MPSRYEIYKKSISGTRELETDIQELENLYKSNKQFQDSYNFDEFVKLSVAEADGKFDGTIADFFAPRKELNYEQKLQPETYYNKLFGTTEEDRIKFDEDKKVGWESTRRTSTAQLSETTAALLNLGRGVATNKLLRGKGVSELASRVLPNETEINRNVDKFFRPLAGRDIYDTKIDPKTGETYYELEEPTTTTEAILRPASQLITGMAITKRPVTGSIDKLGKELKAAARTRGRPSKTQLALEERAAKRVDRFEKVSGKLKPFVRAEAGAQFTFVDDPDFAIVAGGLSNYIGDDDNRMSALFNYLDTDEDSPETARRLSLLLDSAVFSTAFGVALGVGKGSVNTVFNVVNKVKKSGPEGVGQFKNFINGTRGSEVATKTVKPKEIEVPLLSNLEDFAEDGFINQGWKGLQTFAYDISSRGGMYASGMLDIIKSSEYNKIAWSSRAMDIHSKLVNSIKKASKTGTLNENQIEDLFQYYLTGQKKNKKLVKLKDLPEEIREHAKNARDQIDILSEMLVNSKHIPKEIKEKIKANMGKYLRKSYEAFENPNYKPSQEIYNQAVLQIKKGLDAADSNSGRTRPRPTNYNQQKAELYVDKLLNKNKGKAFNNFEDHINSVFGAKNAAQVFKNRQNITPAIDELLGGRVKASTSVFRTIETLSGEMTQYKLMDDLYNQGLGKWFFKGTGKNSVAPDKRMAAEKITGQGFHKLNGVQTSEGIANLFSKMSTAPNPGGLALAYGQALKLKGFSQAAATVYNLTTHVRNTVGGGIILMRNGMNPFTSDTTDALKILDNQIRRSPLGKDKALTNLYEEYQRLGLVNQNVKVGEFKRLFNEFVAHEGNSLIADPLKATSKLSRLNKKVTDIYVAEDDMWRIAGFNKELDTLRKAYPNRSDALLKQEAANIIRDTMPTYDLIAPGIQKLRRLPIGNFFSFTAEQYRNNYNTLLRGVSEIRTGNKILVERGMKRLASQISVTYGASVGVTELTKKIHGISDADEKAVRQLGLANWSKNSALLFDRDEKGNIEYIDLTYTDPSAPITDVIRAYLNEVTDPTVPAGEVGEKVGKGVYEAMKLFLKPFVGPAIFTDKLMDVTFGQGKDYETGRMIKGYNPSESPFSSGNLNVAFKHIGSGLIPKELSDDISLAVGKKSEKIRSGELSLGNELFSKLSGQRTTVLTPYSLERSLSFKLYALSEAQSEQKTFLGQQIRAGVTPQTLLAEFKRANKAYYNEYSKAKLSLEAARHFDLKEKVIQDKTINALRYFTKIDKSNFLENNNAFIPVRFTESQLSSIRRKGNFENFSFTKFYQEYNDLLFDYYSLPIVEGMDEEYKTYTPYELMRLPKSIGGLVEGEDTVPYTKEDPADRVNPYTGEPYQEQMDRLGFNEGTIFGTVEDTLKKASRVAADTVEKLKTERQEPSPEDTQRVNNFLAKHYDRFTTQYPELSDISFEQFKNSAQRLAANVRKIESDNRNVPLGGNNAGSSATGKYQFLRDSVEPAINRTLRRVEPQDKNIFDSIRENKDTSKLNDEAQQLLFFGDIFEKTGSDKHLVPYFLGDEQAGKNVYLYQHHTLSSKVPEYNQETIDRTNKLWNSPE